MKFLTDLIKYFTFITTGIIIVVFIYNILSHDETIPTIMLCEIPAAGFITALITTILLRKEVTSKKEIIIIFTIHFVLVSIVMVIFGLLFGWIHPTPLGVLSMILCVVFVYAFTSIITYFTSKRVADEINIALKTKNDKEKTE